MAELKSNNIRQVHENDVLLYKVIWSYVTSTYSIKIWIASILSVSNVCNVYIFHFWASIAHFIVFLNDFCQCFSVYSLIQYIKYNFISSHVVNVISIELTCRRIYVFHLLVSFLFHCIVVFFVIVAFEDSISISKVVVVAAKTNTSILMYLFYYSTNFLCHFHWLERRDNPMCALAL